MGFILKFIKRTFCYFKTRKLDTVKYLIQKQIDEVKEEGYNVCISNIVHDLDEYEKEQVVEHFKRMTDNLYVRLFEDSYSTTIIIIWRET